MSEQIWWYIARASGIVSWLMLTMLVLWGIVLATDLFPEHRRPAWLLAVHRWLAWLTLTFTGIHIAALVADSYIEFGLADVLIPFASDWQPIPVAAGVVAMWGLLVVQLTSLARRHLPKRVWRGLHLTSYLSFWLVSLHGTFAGTDAANPLYVATSVLTLAAAVFAIAYRILAPGRRVGRAGAAVPMAEPSTVSS